MYEFACQSFCSICAFSALSEAGSKQRLNAAVRSGQPTGNTHRSRSEEKRPVHNVATNRTPRSVTASLSRKRDEEREERRSMMIARRCEEAIEFATQVFSEVAMAKSQFGNSNKATVSKKIASTGGPSQRGAPTLANRGTRKPPRVKILQQISRPQISITDAKPATKGVISTPRRGRGKDPRHRGGRGATPRRGLVSPTTSQALISDEEDQQTTILSDWSVDSQVKRILSRKEDGALAGHLGGSPSWSTVRDAETPRIFTVSGWPTTHAESDQLTDDGNAVSTTTFIDWNEIDQLLQNN
ncbi:unnamed protein product [Dicrocoelium dendriticum]|nr:unnamed protein product [Dicrocoelium dendriticum]